MSKIMFMTDTIMCWQSGIWLHRNEIPGKALSKRGHGVKQVAIGSSIPEHLMNWPDTVIFGRTYPSSFDPVKYMRDFKKLGKRVLYDMDDDFWEVAKDNPSANVSNALKDQYESMIREADAVITPSPILAKKFKKYFKKPVFICPNGTDPELYHKRPTVFEREQLKRLEKDGQLTAEDKVILDEIENKPITIGYMGAASHWKDLQLIGQVVNELAKTHDFNFIIYGLSGEHMEAAMYYYQKMLFLNLQPEKNAYFESALDFYVQLQSIKMMHVPFMPPELHPKTLSRCDLDIGLAPLEDNTFNAGKSCIKFYEYAAVGTVTLASDVEPYRSEVNYRAKNTFKDWYDKLEKLLLYPEFREKIAKEQFEWVEKNRGLDAVGLMWELAIQKDSKGPRVLNQK